ncbi:MAG: COX15/CtaA family protein [Pseudomonadota bacterium]
MSATFRNIVLGTMLLTFVVIVLGAYVRLSDAGLGCPDWPGCYGILLGVPDTSVAIEKANAEFERPVEIGKAWKEMIHRYVAGILGILIFIISILLIRKDQNGQRHIVSGVALSAFLIFQAALGMWTVTLQLKPLVVMGHLLGGFTLFNLLAWQWLRCQKFNINLDTQIASKYFKFSMLAIVILAIQIALGGWVSSNYAALACVDFPTCQRSWWPEMDFKNAFVPWRGLGVDYEFGVLDHPARVAIHYVHRIGAVAVLIVLGFYLHSLAKNSGANKNLRVVALIATGLLIIQLILGFSNVYFKLPLTLAVLHNAVALLLLFSIVSTSYMLKSSHNN